MKVSKKHMRIKHQLTIKGCSEKVLGVGDADIILDT